MMMSKDPTKIQSDDFSLHPHQVKTLKKFGMDVTPVDWNHGYVPFDKHSPNNLKETQESIRDRFNLENAADDLAEHEMGGDD